jgi:hypothetical protein
VTDKTDKTDAIFPISTNARAQCVQLGQNAVSLVSLVRLARILGRSIAAGLNDHDAEMRDAEATAQALADPVAASAGDLLALTRPLAQALSRLPRAAGSPEAMWLDAATKHLEAVRAAQGD